MKPPLTMRTGLYLSFALSASALFVRAADPSPTFAVASIRPSAERVQFERDGRTETSPGILRMRDVTVGTCIKWAYGVQNSQISGPNWLQSERYDIVAKADEPVGDDKMKLMMQTLLAERYKLTFHRQSRELPAYVLTVAKDGHKLRKSVSEGKPARQNSATGTVAKSITMQEFANFISGPLERPVVDMTGLRGKYDFELDFTSYLPADENTMKPESTGIIISALRGELGLKLESQKAVVEVLVVDQAEKPSEN